VRDVFYFSKSPVKMSDLASVAHDIGRSTKFVEASDEQILNICGPSDELLHCIRIDPLGRDYSSFESPQQERIRMLEPQSGFIISFHITSHDTVLGLLKCVLDRYGGWVGSDDNTFETIYDARNIDFLVEP
jgi:hypothetical protein